MTADDTFQKATKSQRIKSMSGECKFRNQALNTLSHFEHEGTPAHLPIEISFARSLNKNVNKFKVEYSKQLSKQQREKDQIYDTHLVMIA